MNPMPLSPPAEARLDADFLRRWPLPVDARCDKKRRGTVLVIGGSPTTPGAVLLAGIAALRAGAGRLQLATDAAIAPQLAVVAPEAMVIAYEGDTFEHLLATASSVVLGPGLLDDATANDLVATALAHVPADVPLIVDALALKAWGTLAPRGRAHVVLTPNHEEVEELIDTDAEDGDRVAATSLTATVASFGRVALPDGRVFVDPSSPPGLGTSGSGDVLAGIIGGLAARSGDGPRSAAWGLFVHGAAAHRLGRRVAPSGYLARELADEVAPALSEIERSVEN